MAVWSARRLSRLVAELGAQTYLEVGVAQGKTILEIAAEHRIGVDPRFRFDAAAHRGHGLELIETTSDDFFATMPPQRVLDVVFLDGLHTFEQTYRDLSNAILQTGRRSVILIDDTWPSDVYSTMRDGMAAQRLRAAETGGESKAWHGDIFKVVFAIHDFHPGLNYRTIVDSGNPQTLVWRSRSWRREPQFDSFEAISRLTYFDFLEHRSLLQPMPEDEAIGDCLRELNPLT